MSLTGNLEDLPLLDILQIVSFSKKTGFLSIETEAGRGAIVFDGGFVVAAFTWETPPLDPRARTLEPEKRDAILRARIEMALEHLIRLREGLFDFSLTDHVPLDVADRDIEMEILSQGINAQELLLDLARGMDEDRRNASAAVEASFAEAPPDETDAGLDALLDPPAPAEHAPELEPVAEPEPVAAPPAPVIRPKPDTIPQPRPGDPTRTLPLTPPPAETPPPPLPPPPPPPPAPAPLPTVLLVDDEEEVRQVLAAQFTAAGHAVEQAEDVDGAVRKGTALGKAGTEFVLVIDIGMPSTGGTSFVGGLEAVKKLQKAGVKPATLMMTESLSQPIQARAREMGVKVFVFKPGLSKLDPEQFQADLQAFAAKICGDVLPRLSRPGEAAATPPPLPARKAAPPLPVPGKSAAPVPVPDPASAPVPPKPPAATVDELSRELAMLGQRLDELRRPQDPTQIAALVMTVAREFFERSVLFLVKGDELRGVNGFGVTARGDALNLLARDLVIPLSERSIFSDIANARRGFTGPLPVSALTTDLMDSIGRLKSGDAALLPLVTQRETIAILYGDNPETGRPPGRLDGLRVFINQAGIALENAMLHRKVHALTGQE